MCFEIIGKLQFLKNIFDRNGAENGGALYIDNSENIYIENIFENNKANNKGGAIY